MMAAVDTRGGKIPEEKAARAAAAPGENFREKKKVEELMDTISNIFCKR